VQGHNDAHRTKNVRPLASAVSSLPPAVPITFANGCSVDMYGAALPYRACGSAARSVHAGVADGDLDCKSIESSEHAIWAGGGHAQRSKPIRVSGE
jgi:hypothetical protein